MNTRVKEDEDEEMGEADDQGAQGHGGDEGENEGRRKRVRIGGVLIEDAVREIEKWIAEVRIDWEKQESEQEKLMEEAWDDVKGGKLKVEDVRKARKEEVSYMVKRGIWKLVPTAECWRKTGRAPIGTRWVDTNKGSDENPDVRCRLVARDFKVKADKEREDLFAATPPAEAERMALSRAVTRSWSADGRQKVRKIVFVDAKKAHLNPICEDDVFIELPAEAERPLQTEATLSSGTRPLGLRHPYESLAVVHLPVQWRGGSRKSP